MHHKIISTSKFALVVLLIVMVNGSLAQQAMPGTLNIGDQAPPLQVSNWVKGIPFKTFKKGTVYVVEFWATWCRPCIAAVPHLTALARQYRDKLIVVGIDVYEKNTPLEKVKYFADSMDYYVATDKNKFMETFWVKASGNEGIPKTIIVNANGKVAWIGHPKHIDKIVPKILNNTWDIKQALVERNLKKYLKIMDDSISIELAKFMGDNDPVEGEAFVELNDPGKPDSALFYINKIIKQEPRLQYQPYIAYHTLYALLKIDPKKAYAFGKKALTTSADCNFSIISAIARCMNTLKLSTEFIALGADAYQVYIDEFPYPELVNIPKYYHQMAWLYWLAKNKLKAIEAEQTAVNILKSRETFFASELALYKAQLELYKICSVDD